MDMAEDASWTSSVSLMGIYKVPLICRTLEYGHSVSILGSRPLNRIWVCLLYTSQAAMNMVEHH